MTKQQVVAKRVKRNLDGMLLLDKPIGMSSNDALQKVKRIFNAKKAGHTGALDPLATGMLPLCFGETTKFSQFLLDADKRYHVVARLGVRTDTSDAEGAIVSERPVSVDRENLEKAILKFKGDIMQTPSMFSALKHQGRPLYEYARKGIVIEREARPITVYQIELLGFSENHVKLDIHCSKGTYIRTIVDDLGEMLGCGAHVTYLRRIQVAKYPYDKLVTLDQLLSIKESVQEDDSLLDELLLPVDSPVVDYPAIYLLPNQEQKILQGQTLIMDHLPAASFVRLFSESSKQFIGIAEVKDGKRLTPKRLIMTESELI